MGCTTVVTPLKPGAGTSLEAPDHGYVLGRVHLQWNGKTQTAGKFPFTMKWRLTDEKNGTQLVIDQVPVQVSCRRSLRAEPTGGSLPIDSGRFR